MSALSSIRVQLIIPAMTALGFLILVSVLGITGIRTQQNLMDVLLGSTLKEYEQIHNIAVDLSSTRTNFYRLLALIHENAEATRVAEFADEQMRALSLSASALHAWTQDQALSAEMRSNGKLLEQSILDYQKEVAQGIQMMDVDPNMTAMLVMSADTKFAAITDAATQMLALTSRHMSEVGNQSRGQAKQVFMLFLLVALAAIVISLIVALTLGRKLQKALGSFIETIARNASGDLTLPTPMSRFGEIGNAESAFEKMRLSITRIVKDIRAQVNSVQVTAEGIKNRCESNLRSTDMQM